MMKKRYLKTVKEKIETKLNSLLNTDGVKKSGNSFLFKDKKIFSITDDKLSYGTLRASPARIDPFYEDDFKVSIILNQENINLLGNSLLKPPSGTYIIYKILKDHISNIKEIEIGSIKNEIKDSTVFITKELYLAITKINKEEGLHRDIRLKNRTIPFLKTDFSLENLDEINADRDYGLLLREIISSNQLTSNDILSLTNKLEPGDDSKIVIRQEINKQTEWLLEILRKIVDEQKLTKTLAKEYGKQYFNYSKNSITGPEHLMEKILTDYGKNIIFGVPALLNTDKYVISRLPNVQFDIILIDSLSDVEIVELKRPDIHVLDYDQNRNKFYPSKDLSVAIGQAERYITTMYKDNDHDFKIKGKTIKKYIESEIGGTIELNVTRPSATIIIGGIQRLAVNYIDLVGKKPRTKDKYEENMWQAYRELKNTHKNIKIITYSELIDGAELRLKSF